MKDITRNKNVFLWGTFDILHEGHLKLLGEAAKLGNLHVILMPDHKVRTWKKIVFDENTRRRNLLATGYPKEVFVDALPEMKCFESVKPDLFCFGYDQDQEWMDKLKNHISERFPSCEFRVMEKYADIHSSDLRKTIACACGSGTIWLNCHGK